MNQENKSVFSPTTLNFNIPEGATSGSLPGLVIQDQYTATFQLSPPLSVKDNSCLDLVSCSFPYSQPNIATAGVLQSVPNGNNRITITFGPTTTDMLLPTGLYSYFDVQYQMNAYAVSQSWISPGSQLFILTGIQSTQQLTITVDPTVILAGAWGVAGQVPALGMAISFVNPSVVSGLNNSIGDVLGFGVAGPTLTLVGTSTTLQTFTSPNAADFASVTAYNLNCSLVSGSYVNGTTGQLLYSFQLGDVTPNTIATFNTNFRFPVPAFPGSHSKVSFFFTDNSGFKLPLNRFQGAVAISFILSRNKPNGSI